MKKAKPSIDALFYEKEEIDKELKCPSCLQKLVSPRLLPCGDLICLRCIQFIKIQNSNLYKCPACLEDHTFQAENLPKIKMLEKLLNKDANEVYRNRDVEKLKERLANLNAKTEKLENHFAHPHETIKEHCKNLLDQIDFATEKSHQLINEFHDSFYNQVKTYEKECLDHFDNLKRNKDTILAQDLKSIETVLCEARVFFQQKVDYFRRFKIDDEEINRSLLVYDELISKVKDHLGLLKSHLFKTNRMKFVENTIEVKCDLIGKLEMYPVTNGTIHLKTPSLSYNNSITSHKIFGAELLNDDYVVSISLNNNNVELNKLVETGIVQTNRKVLQDYPKSTFFIQYDEDITIKSITSKGEIIILVKSGNPVSFYNFKILIFDSNCNLLCEKIIMSIKNIISVAENDSIFYCLLTSSSNVNFLSIYDFDLNLLDTKGLEARKSTDAFYFSAKAIQLRVSNKLIFVLETGLMKLMNEETGIVMKVFPVFGSSFEFFKNSLVLFDHHNTLTIYDTTGKKIKNIVLPDEFKKCNSSFLSNLNVIGFSSTNEKILISKIIL